MRPPSALVGHRVALTLANPTGRLVWFQFAPYTKLQSFVALTPEPGAFITLSLITHHLPVIVIVYPHIRSFITIVTSPSLSLRWYNVHWFWHRGRHQETKTNSKTEGCVGQWSKRWLREWCMTGTKPVKAANNSNPPPPTHSSGPQSRGGELVLRIRQRTG